jgi:metallo-beta-lactamase family protein
MLPDSGHIQEMEEEWQMRKNGRAGKAYEEALYTMQDGIDACKSFRRCVTTKSSNRLPTFA